MEGNGGRPFAKGDRVTENSRGREGERGRGGGGSIVEGVCRPVRGRSAILPLDPAPPHPITTQQESPSTGTRESVLGGKREDRKKHSDGEISMHVNNGGDK